MIILYIYIYICIYIYIYMYIYNANSDHSASLGCILTTAQVELQFSDVPRSYHILLSDIIVGRYSIV